jgi:hypothetical protein
VKVSNEACCKRQKKAYNFFLNMKARDYLKNLRIVGTCTLIQALNYFSSRMWTVFISGYGARAEARQDRCLLQIS